MADVRPQAATPTETEEKNTWGWIKWAGTAAGGWFVGEVAKGVVQKPVMDAVKKYTVEPAVAAIKRAVATPAGIGVTSGVAVHGALNAGVAVVGISRAKAVVDDAARANVGLPPITRTPFLRLPIF